MKKYLIYITAILLFFLNKSFSQTSANQTLNSQKLNGFTDAENNTKNKGIIIAYDVKEIINMSMGKRIITYQVSKLSLVDTYDLGPNNIRIITPVYKKEKIEKTEKKLKADGVEDSVSLVLNTIDIDDTVKKKDSSTDSKYLTLDIVKTYAKVLDKGYSSSEMLIKVADRAYFDGDFKKAVKYYSELNSSNVDQNENYYYRYSQSLKEIKNIKKANEILRLYEEKKLSRRKPVKN